MANSKNVSPWVLRGKLRPPLGHQSLIARSELVSSLDDLLNYQASVIVAPAGYGKTTLLTLWRERLIQAGGKAGWLTIESQDADPYRFLCYTIFALAEAGVDFGQLEMFAEQGLTELPLESVVVRFLAFVEDTAGPVVLILDDYHRLDTRQGSPSVDNLLDTLIENAPSNLHLVVSARHRPNFKVAQLCVTGRGVEIDAETLRFSHAEMQQALGTIGDDGLLEAIKATTEGWPVAVQLARLAYGGKSTLDTLPVTGRDGHIAHFFSEQIVAGLSNEQQQFLSRTAILDQFNLELANAVYEGHEASRILRDLSDLRVLIVQLDEAGEWYRYHHLFSEFLLNLLKEREPNRLSALHGNASSWFEEDGDTGQAVRHAVLAGNFARAARLIEAAGGWELILFGGIGYLRNLLNLIADNQLALFPRLGIAKAYLLLKMGDLISARACFDHACTQYQAGVDKGASAQGFKRDAINIGAMLSSYEDDEPALVQWSAMEPQTLPGGEPDTITNGMLACQRAVQEIYTGKFDSARGTLRDAVRYMRRGNSMLGLNYCYIHAAVNNLYQCNMNQALANARESSSMASDNYGNDSGLKSLSDVVLNSLLFWRNELTGEDWQRFETACEYTARYDGWFEIYALGLETAVEHALLCGDADAANQSIDRARRLAQVRSIERLEWYADTMALMVASEHGDKRNALRLARDISERHPIGLWRQRCFLWRNHVHAALALASHFAEIEPGKSDAFIEDAMACCRHFGARFLLLRTLSMQASLLDRTGRRQAALEALHKAIVIAEPQGVPVVIARPRPLLALLRHTQSQRSADSGDTAIRHFIRAAINLMQSSGRRLDGEASGVSLSPREMEVLWELSLGRANKQIARSLCMTEHTVKFHLKNVFRKLSANRRTEALKIAHEYGLL